MHWLILAGTRIVSAARDGSPHGLCPRSMTAATGRIG